MKKSSNFYVTIAIAAILAGVTVMGCKSSQSSVATKSGSAQSQTENPFGDTFDVPCSVYDTDEYFAATGIASGPSTQKGTIQQTALTNAQNMVRQKMQHAYEGFIDNYFESIGANKGTDIETQTRGVGRQTIMAVVNNTSHSCLRFSGVDARGNVECYIAIQISKQKLAEAITDNLSKNQKEEIRDHAEKMRAELQEVLKESRGQ
ncbi:MAG: hypothetical protein FWG84_02055 [Bacteroidales bacterium]|nr:hypothetical protein [Bacteroidales bacterium]